MGSHTAFTTQISNLIVVNAGLDLIVNSGFVAARDAVGELVSQVQIFLTSQGYQSDQDSAFPLSSTGFSGLMGLAWQDRTETGKLVVGSFFEAGENFYRSEAQTAAPWTTDGGEGVGGYYGGGVLGRFEFSEGLYFEGAVRLGKAKTSFLQDEERAPTFPYAQRSEAGYSGIYAGIGKVWYIEEMMADMDVSFKNLWSFQEGDTYPPISSGYPTDFSVGSHRWRTGVKFTFADLWPVIPSMGFYYEEETDGNLSFRAWNGPGPTPSLKGNSSGIIDLGVSLYPSLNTPLIANVGVQGYVGDRHGIAISGQVKIPF